MAFGRIREALQVDTAIHGFDVGRVDWRYDRHFREVAVAIANEQRIVRRVVRDRQTAERECSALGRLWHFEGAEIAAMTRSAAAVALSGQRDHRQCDRQDHDHSFQNLHGDHQDTGSSPRRAH